MLLYNTHGWIHLSIGRPERWFRWGLMEFVCTASLFLLALRWGPSGIALAWTASYFLLMFPGFWYAGKPIGLGIGSVFAVIWKFLAASALAGCVTALIISAMPRFAIAFGASSAFVNMVSVSLVFFGLYFAGVIALHQGLRPLSDTVVLLRDLLPERMVRRTFPEAVDTEGALAIPAWGGKANPQADFPGDAEPKP
jgi:PST family polysaccharide transporter